VLKAQGDVAGAILDDRIAARDYDHAVDWRYCTKANTGRLMLLNSLAAVSETVFSI
jgi:hypothetical protein